VLPPQSSFEEFRRKVNRHDYPEKYHPTRNWEVTINRAMLAYTLSVWKWGGPPIGAILAPGKGESAAKMAATRAIQTFVSVLGFPIPRSPEFLSTLCPAHQKDTVCMSAETGGPLKLPRERHSDAGSDEIFEKTSSQQERPTTRDLLKRIDSLSADQLREMEREHRDVARESIKIADELASLAAHKEADKPKGNKTRQHAE
jgi:hypothetical protein